MPLDYQSVPVPFHRGVDTKSDSKSVSNDRLLKLENGEFAKDGKISLRKGYTKYARNYQDHDATATTGSVTSAKSLASRGGEVVLMDGDAAYSWSDASDCWVGRGGLISAICDVKTVSSTQSEQTGADHCENGGLSLYAWEDSRGGVYYTIEDSVTGVVHAADQVASATGSRPHCVNIGEKLALCYFDSATSAIKLKSFHPDSVHLGVNASARTIVTGIPSGAVYDVCSYNSSHSILVYVEATGNMVATRFNALGQREESTNLGISFPTTYITVAWDESTSEAGKSETSRDNAFVGFAYGTNQRIKVLNVANHFDVEAEFTVSTSGSGILGAVGTAMTIVPLTQSAGDDSIIHVYSETTDTSGTEDWDNRVAFGSYEEDGTVVSAQALFSRQAGLGTKAWADDSYSYVTLTFESTLQSSYFVLRSDGQIVARLLGGIAPGHIHTGHLPGIQNASGEAYSFCGVFQSRLDAVDPDNDTAESSVYSEEGIKRISLDFDHAQGYHAVQMGSSLYVNGGILHEYDGSKVQEAGFLLYPEPPDPDVTNVSTPGPDAGTYYYHMYWEHKNIQGERRQSSFAGSKESDLSAGSVSSAWAEADGTEIPALPFTHRDNVALAVYRTQVSTTSMTRVSPLDPTETGSATQNAYVDNDKATGYVEFEDVMVDDDIDGAEADYQNTGELDNIAPPACTIMGATKDRLFLAGGEINESSIRYSKLYQAGRPLSFNDALVIDVDRSGGEITGLAPLNDSLAIFKRNRIYVVDGDGPTNLGFGGNLFGEPQLVTTDCGCINQKTIVQVPDGLMFQSAKGIYLLTRQWKTVYIGAFVEAYNDQTFTAATLVPDSSQVIFLAESGSSLMYDYFYKQWSIYTIHEGEGACAWGGRYCYVNSVGQLMKQDDSYLHGGTPYRLRVQTAWLKFAEGMQSYQSIREGMLLGTFYGHHTLVAKVSYDYKDQWVDAKTWATSSAIATSVLGTESGDATGDGTDNQLGDNTYLGGSPDVVYQVRIFPSRIKCQAIRFEFSNDPISSSGRAFELSELALQVAPLGRGLPLEAARNI